MGKVMETSSQQEIKDFHEYIRSTLDAFVLSFRNQKILNLSGFDHPYFYDKEPRRIEVTIAGPTVAALGAHLWEKEERYIVSHQLSFDEKDKAISECLQSYQAANSENAEIEYQQGNVSLKLVFLPAGKELPLDQNLPEKPDRRFSKLGDAYVDGRRIQYSPPSLLMSDLPKIVATLDSVKKVEGEKSFSFYPLITFNDSSEDNVRIKKGKTLEITGNFIDMARRNPAAFEFVLRHERGHFLNGDLSALGRGLISVTSMFPSADSLDLIERIVDMFSGSGIEKAAALLSSGRYTPEEAKKYAGLLCQDFTNLSQLTGDLAGWITSYPDHADLDAVEVAATWGNKGSFDKHLREKNTRYDCSLEIVHIFNPLLHSVMPAVKDQELYTAILATLAPLEQQVESILEESQLIRRYRNMLLQGAEYLADLHGMVSGGKPQDATLWLNDKNAWGEVLTDTNCSHPADPSRREFSYQVSTRLDRIRAERRAAREPGKGQKR